MVAFWGKILGVGIASLFFLLIGIDTLWAAYHLNNPHEFIAYFFSANLMILISLVGVIYALFQAYTMFFGRRMGNRDKES
jgi:dolichyl-phosphate-mannose--protein O-mannosyl transferase